MAKFKTPILIRGIEEDKYFEPNKEFEMTVKRATELEKNIKAIEGFEDFKLERIEESE